jgi:hypothetical protein
MAAYRFLVSRFVRLGRGYGICGSRCRLRRGLQRLQLRWQLSVRDMISG